MNLKLLQNTGADSSVKNKKCGAHSRSVGEITDGFLFHPCVIISPGKKKRVTARVTR